MIPSEKKWEMMILDSFYSYIHCALNFCRIVVFLLQIVNAHFIPLKVSSLCILCLSERLCLHHRLVYFLKTKVFMALDFSKGYYPHK